MLKISRRSRQTKSPLVGFCVEAEHVFFWWMEYV